MAGYPNTHDQAIERENVELLTGMMGDLDPEVARRVLRKCNGDVQKAATAILEGDRGEAAPWSSKHTMTPIHPEHKPAQSSVIDLTADDDDLTRALEASLQPQDGTKFGPSDRTPNPDWAMVPSSNVATSSVSHDDRTLSRAIEESLSSSYNDFATEAYEDLPIEKSVREGGRPVALRPTSPTLTYAALVIQGLFAVPQVRQSIAAWRPYAPIDATVVSPPTSGSGQLMWPLVELFANMDMAQLSALVADQVLKTFSAQPWSNATELPGDLSSDFLRSVADVITKLLHQQFEDDDYQGIRPRLFFFSYSRINIEPNSDLPHIHEDCIVTVDTCSDGITSNDLISRLSTILSRYHEGGSNHDVILEPSHVIAFYLRSNRPTPSSVPSSSSSAATLSSAHKGFRYPKLLYLDQFLGENFDLANEKRTQQMAMNADVQRLMLHRNSIMHFNGKDTLKDLRASLHYYEKLADAKGNPERQASIDITAIKLRKILVTVEKEIEATDKQIADLKACSAVLFDCPELQKHKYDLRVVLVHDGLFGRRQLHSYVKDKGVWWKSVDSDVTEVSEETVLNDPAGIHLGAGPYLLIYSREIPEHEGGENMSLPWPQPLKDHVKYHNREFLSSLDPAIVAKAQPLYSPPLSSVPLPGQTGARTSYRSGTEELMDVSNTG